MKTLDVLTYTHDGNRLTRLGTDEYTAFMPVYLQGAANTLTDNDDREVLRRRYCGNFIYEDGILQRVLVEGGFITFSNGTPQYHFYIKDHLGSNRVVTDANGNIEEYNHYYPYGALMNISSASTQPYKYNGKELNRLNRLLWYDQSARQYNPILGRFMSMDPLCEKYYSISPYAFCANNPVKYVDPDGREVYPIGDMAFQTILNTLSEEEQKFISLDQNGMIDNSLIDKCSSNSNNFTCLRELVASPLKIFVTTESKTEFVINGEIKSEKFNAYDTDEEFADTQFLSCVGNTTGETGNLGVCYMLVSNGEIGKSPLNGDIQVNINPNLSPLGASETFSHEGYAHAYIYVTTHDRNAAIHHFQDGGREGNQLLIDCSIRARKETVKNMLK